MSKSFAFWRGWLFYTSLLFALYGLVLAFFGNSILFRPYFNALNSIFWPGEGPTAQTEQFRLFVCGPLGGTIACTYILLAYLAWFPFSRKEKWVIVAILISFGTWFIIDSAVCIYYGVYFQVYIINTFSLLQKALPLIFTWKEFYKKTG